MWARRPVSRVLCRPRDADAAAIPLDRPLPDGSRDQPGHLGPVTVLPSCEGALSLFGLAPGGACHAVPVARSAVRSYRTLSPLPHAIRTREGRFAFCGAIPGIAPGGCCPPPCHRGARTFLDPRRSRDRPAIWPAAQMGRDDTGVNFFAGFGALGGRSVRPSQSVSSPMGPQSGRRGGGAQAQQGHQPGAGLAVGAAVDQVGPPVALEGRDHRRGVGVIAPRRRAVVAQPG
jgi:hypothetical protein